MSVNLYQDIINQVKSFIKEELGVMDTSGQVIACSDENKVGETIDPIIATTDYDDTTVRNGGRIFQKVAGLNHSYEIAFISDDSENSLNILKLFSVNIGMIRALSDEKLDKGSLIKSIIFEDILPGEAVLKAKELNISLSVQRAVFLIKTEKGRELHSYEILQNLFPNKARDYVIIVDKENALLIKEFKSNQDAKELYKIAEIIIDTLNTESMIKAVVGIGTIVDNLTDISRSYKEARTALLIGSVFESEKSVINYNNLGLGRLIYQLPHNICIMFLKEIFEKDVFEVLDDEYMLTIQKFFENNLNISETSRQMYLHRNTLVYRLDKIKKITGLDLTKFDDAIVFKVAVLVRRYLDKAEKKV